jgi:hypothetical protein
VWAWGWGLWATPQTPMPQSPIPNPQMKNLGIYEIIYILIINLYFVVKKLFK